MKVIDKKLIRCFEYASYRIYLYPKKLTIKAVEFYLINPQNKITKETIWIPKSSMDNKNGIEYSGIDWIFNEYENREKIEKIKYKL